MQKARDKAAAKYQEAESAIAQLRSDLEDEKRIKAWIGDARDKAEGRRREAEATISRLEVEIGDAKRRTARLRKARDDAEGKRREAESTITRLRVELEDAKRNADGRGTQEGTARQILGVPAGASRNDVRAAFKRVARTVHPDRNPGPEANRLMQLANDALGWLKARNGRT